MRIAALVALVLVAGILAAGPGAEPKTGSRAPTYFQNVKPILDGRCGNCHMAGGIAPFSLRSYSQARRNRTAIAAAVGARLMPPWHAERKYRRYLWDPSLSKAQISALTRWATAGGPKGDAATPGAPLPPVSGGLTRADVSLPLPTYTPKRGKQDDYHCFVVPWPGGRDTSPGSTSLRASGARCIT